MMPTAWAFFDPRGMGITLSLSAALLALALVISHRALGRRLPGMQPAAWGVLLVSVGFALNMLQGWLLPLVGLVLAVRPEGEGVVLAELDPARRSSDLSPLSPRRPEPPSLAAKMPRGMAHWVVSGVSRTLSLTQRSMVPLGR